MERKRIIWADSLKGVLMLLVIIGHAISCVIGAAAESNHAWNLIYSFHMPAFMALSGWLAYDKKPGLNGGGVKLLHVVSDNF